MKKKIALVTGASGGIGGACAEKLAREGYTVLVHGCRGLRQAEALADRLCAEGHDAHAVERAFPRVHGRPQQAVREPELERDAVRQREDGDPVPRHPAGGGPRWCRHGRILTHVGCRATRGRRPRSGR